MSRLVAGWLLPQEERGPLLALVPPRYPRLVAHHVTLKPGVGKDHPLRPEKEGRIVGVADDGKGVQALVVEIGGTTDRPDGSTWHITWSLGAGRKPVESSDVIRSHGWKPLEPPRTIRLEPAVFDSTQ
ncbi:hypothetical protein J8J14_12655 [Roseomonas sp. SSH11]|uniref:Uncharacterized protein n=1 Tax=Pararoseomonas baculiformis TaxID=2820812 RepID=A0ABS4AF10_9PROT|nr:hypothetical protein [Pararoseomonas baculiformis]MBP0445627.1 hypothetical protein [Pararoseomonas baculiformis]